MSDGWFARIGRGRVALGLPLAGMVLLWLMVLAGEYADLFLRYSKKMFNDPVAQQNAFHVSSYLWLVGLIGLGLAATTSRRMTHSPQGSRLERAVRVFSLVAVFVTLILCAIWGVSIFLSNFMTNWYYGSGSAPAPNELMRVVNVYLPIVIAAALMVFVILRSFVGLNEGTDEEAENAQ